MIDKHRKFSDDARQAIVNENYFDKDFFIVNS